jgi:hypothetical protein
VLAVARVDVKSGKITYRTPEIWTASAKLLITQKGLPWGRLSLPTTSPESTTPTTQSGQVFADPTRLASLAPFYAQLANSAAMQSALPPGAVKASPVVDNSTPYASVLPILQFTAISTNPTAAEFLAHKAANLFRGYVTSQQSDASIPDVQRVRLQPLNDTLPPQLLQPRKKSLAIVAFVTIMIATLGLAFVLENIRPRSSVGLEVASDEPDASADRRATLGQRTA